MFLGRLPDGVGRCMLSMYVIWPSCPPSWLVGWLVGWLVVSVMSSRLCDLEGGGDGML